mmetsp:Transcript_46816/g.81393  ORF Transcript_46816/g.81393 Transcript_46816/m.81393 type:complete len:293 (+) Transcript_46816:111-989(+)
MEHGPSEIDEDVYKVVALVDGRLLSIFDATTEYTIGVRIDQLVLPGHGGGFYVSRTPEEALRAVSSLPRRSRLLTAPRALLRCRAQGKYLSYGSGKLAVSALTPLEVKPVPHGEMLAAPAAQGRHQVPGRHVRQQSRPRGFKSIYKPEIDSGAGSSADERNALAGRYGQAIAKSLLGDGKFIGGFEDDPIAYVHVGGWPGGPPPPRLEAQLSSGLERVFREDMQRLATQMESKERQQREELNQEAYNDWKRRKAVEAGQRITDAQHRAAARSRPSSAPQALQRGRPHGIQVL